MIAAIYARKSTEQIGVNAEEKCVNAQVNLKHHLGEKFKAI